MDPLEQQLKGALARKDPPAGFAARVAARSARPRVVAMMSAPRWSIAAAAMLVVAVGGGTAYRRHQGEVAKEQVMTAMRLTAVKLHRVQAHVREVRQ